MVYVKHDAIIADYGHADLSILDVNNTVESLRYDGCLLPNPKPMALGRMDIFVKEPIF